MAPNLLGKSAIYENESNSADPVQIIGSTKPGFQEEVQPLKSTQSKSQEKHYKHEIVWRNVILFIYLHIAGIYGLYGWLFQCQWKTFFYTYLTAAFISQGVTTGAHRLWAHRAYKARLPLRILLGFFQTAALQNHIYEWCRDHRVHHKFTDTDADPHNSTRGFFFSHMGWLLVKKHKDVITRGKTVDLSDLEADPVVRFQRKYYKVLAPICCFVIPSSIPWYFWNEESWIAFNTCGIARYVLSLHGTWLINSAAHMFGTRPYDKYYMVLAPICCFVIPALIPWYYWNEDPWTCWNTCAMFRYVITLHGTWLVNSAAHMWGTKPYDRTINPVETKTVAIITFGEGWHNYHHTFPWDYKAAELGDYSLNFSTATIDFFYKLGLAYDLKTASLDIIKKRVKRTGDGSWKFQYKDADGSAAKEPVECNNGEGVATIVEEPSDLDKIQHEHSHGEYFWGWGDRDMKDYDKSFVEIHNKNK